MSQRTLKNKQQNYSRAHKEKHKPNYVGWGALIKKKKGAEAHTASCHGVSKETPATDCMSVPVMQNSRQSVAPV